MRSVQDFTPGLYEATVTGVRYSGSSQELLLFTDLEILNPDEFVERFNVISNGEWIGAWFGEDDLDLWLQLYN